LQVRSLRATRVGNDVEGNLLTFVQAAHAGSFHGGSVHEHVLAAAFRRDEAKALGGIEEFHGSDSHVIVPALFSMRRMPDGAGLYGVAGKEVQPSSRRALRAGRISLGALHCN